MMLNDIRERLIHLLNPLLEARGLTSSDSIRNDGLACIDSLAAMDLILAIEQEWKVEVEPADLFLAESLNDVAAVIASRVAGGEA